MPYPFSRLYSINLDHRFDFAEIKLLNDGSFALVKDSAFLVFDCKRGMEFLSSTEPNCKVIFNEIGEHGGHVYVPEREITYLFEGMLNFPSTLRICPPEQSRSYSNTIYPRLIYPSSCST